MSQHQHQHQHQHHHQHEHRRSFAMLIVCCAMTIFACGTKSTGTPTRDPVPSANAPPRTAAVVAPSASGATTPPLVDKTIPTLILEPFTPTGSTPSALFAIEGGLMVVDGQRVGRIVGEGVEWIGKIPKSTPGMGDNNVESVQGRFPDSVGVLYYTSQGRAPAPTYWPLTGKGTQHTEAPGGGWGSIHVARVGESTILATESGSDGYRLITVRGPKLARTFLTAKSNCKPGEVTTTTWNPEQVMPALVPRAFESTPSGTLVSIGTLCEKRAPAAEVWDSTTGNSRIVDLGSWWKRIGYSPKLLKGSGDELWAFSDGFHAVLRYHDGSFDPVPELTSSTSTMTSSSPIQKVFVSPSGQLHALTSNQTIHRLEEGKWIALGRIAEPVELRALAVEKDNHVLWAASASNKVYRLREREGSRVPAEEACNTWFVYLYAVSGDSSSYTFPATRKALSTFPEVSDLALVEFEYPRQLGVTVTSKAQGEALILHVKATMKDEDPKLYCYRPQQSLRKIDIDAKGK